LPVVDPERFCFSYRLDWKDIYRFLKHHTVRKHRGWTWGAYVLAILWFGSLPAREGKWIEAGVLCILLTALFPPILFGILRLQALNWTRNNPLMTTRPATLEVTAEGVHSRGEWGEARVAWNSYHEIVGTPEQILLYRGKTFAEIVPRAAFASPEAADAFLHAAQQWHAAATRNSAL
jgi:hypothetical protein